MVVPIDEIGRVRGARERLRRRAGGSGAGEPSGGGGGPSESSSIGGIRSRSSDSNTRCADNKCQFIVSIWFKVMVGEETTQILAWAGDIGQKIKTE
jgi:hypothetical protein